MGVIRHAIIANVTINDLPETNMIIVVIDSNMMSKLHHLSQPLELRDESGRILARVFPAVDVSQNEPLVPQVSDEELDRREQANEKRYSTAEVLAHLKTLG